MSGKSKSQALVDNTARRTWDKAEFEAKAAEKEKRNEDKDETLQEAKRRRRHERDPLHQGIIVQRSALKVRDSDLDLTSRLGKTQVVGLNTPLNQQAGFYCSVCDCVLRDSQSYLDHLNGKWHNRALGMNMKPERATLEQVRERLEKHKEERGHNKAEDYLPDGIDRRLLAAEEQEEREKEERRQRRREKKRGKEESDHEKEEEEDGDNDMMALMGFGGFGSSKK